MKIFLPKKKKKNKQTNKTLLYDDDRREVFNVLDFLKGIARTIH